MNQPVYFFAKGTKFEKLDFLEVFTERMESNNHSPSLRLPDQLLFRPHFVTKTDGGLKLELGDR